MKENPKTSNKRVFLLILTAFVFMVVVSWPVLFSLSLWAFEDRGSFLNLDYLLALHLRLGVDTYYAYGLLPVLIQHVLFVAFGRGHWPMIGCSLVALILFAVFWTRLLNHLPGKRMWLVIVILLTPTVLWVNPNFPYSLVQLSMLFALLFVLDGRFDIAMALSSVGCFSVPSLPLALTGLLFLLIVAQWWTGSNRTIGHLFAKLAPGICTYGSLLILLTVVFGTESVLATALPILGMRFYRAVNFGTWSALMTFIHPPGHSMKYYALYGVGSPVTWWIVSTIMLLGFAVLGARAMLRSRRIEPRPAFVVICGIIQSVFLLFAYGSAEQHIIYDPVLIAGTLVGLSSLPIGRVRRILLVIFVFIGVLGQSAQLRNTYLAWKNTGLSVNGATFYDKPAWISEWSKIVDISAKRRLLMLSYGTGVHHYFPTVQTADAWFMRKGEFFPADKDRLLLKLSKAEVVVEDVNEPTSLIDDDADIQGELSAMCLTTSTSNFQIWWRDPPSGRGGTRCEDNLRRRQSGL